MSPDYAVLLIMAVFIFACGSWVVSARKWFTGPLPNIDDSSTTASLNVNEKDTRKEKT